MKSDQRNSLQELLMHVLPLLSGHLQASCKHIEDNALDQASAIKRISGQMEKLLLEENMDDIAAISTAIHKEAGTLLYSLQYQDRVNQILTNIAMNIDRLIAEVRHTSHEPLYEIDVQKWLREMKNGYATVEQHVQHIDDEDDDHDLHASSGDVNFL